MKSRSPLFTLIGTFVIASSVFAGFQRRAAAQSADGGKLACTCSPGFGTADIYSVNADGTGLTALTADGKGNNAPAWSPDGSQLVYVSTIYGNNSNLVRVAADGTHPALLTDTDSPLGNFTPNWSPDGTKIVFSSARGGSATEIWVMNADATNLTRLTTGVRLDDGTSITPVFSSDSRPRWSPDGKKILFYSNREGLTFTHLYVMNADGAGLTRLTNHLANDTDPAWSPDGKKIAYVSGKQAVGDHNGVYVMDAVGSSEVRISDVVFGGLAWSPDGTRIAFYDRDPAPPFEPAVFVMNSDGTNRVKVTGNTNSCFDPAWQTTSGPAPPPAPTPTPASVTGRVTDPSMFTLGGGAPGVPGVTVALSGSASAETTTDANGRFTFQNLPDGGTFNLTPHSPNWGMSPLRVTFSTTEPTFNFFTRSLTVGDITALPIFITFSFDTYFGVEDSSAVITVVKSGPLTGDSTIDYATGGGTARAGVRYTPVSGTLRFAPGDSTKSFTVPVIYDHAPEGNETVNLKLSNPTGSLDRGGTSAVLTVSDRPTLLVTEASTTRAAALDSVKWVRDPFPLTTPDNLSQDSATRVMLFVSYLDLLPGENASTVTAFARDSSSKTFQLPVEFVGRVPGFDWLTQVNVKLPADLPHGDVSVWLVVRGTSTPAAHMSIE
jgi:Tol biopolymer transport system component